MKSLISALSKTYPEFNYTASDIFVWSPRHKTVFYDAAALHTPEAPQQLLHETAHALLGHRDYTTDLELVQMEAAAWQHAKAIAPQFRVTIDPVHAEQCMNSYRHWLYKRSLCPVCSQSGLQSTASQYRCINCTHTWRVSRERFCRPYRLSTKT
jgi:hypothetical protein